MKRHILLYSLTALFAIGFAGIASGYSLPRLPAPAGMATPVFLDGLFGGKQDEQKKAPEHPINSDEIFNSDEYTTVHSPIPYQKVELGFSIRVPKDWPDPVVAQKKDSDIGQKLIGNLAQFDAPMISTFQPRIYIQALEMEHEIDAEHWLRHHILISGYTPVGPVTADGPRKASGHYIYLQDGTSIYAYISAHINKNTILLAKFEIPAQLQQYMKYLQHASIDSFTLTYPEETPIEEQRSFTLVDSIKFNYPGSWILADPDFRDMNRLVVQLKNNSQSGSLQGFARIMAVRRNRNTNLQSELENLKLYFQDVMKVSFIKLESSGKSAAYDRFMFNRYEVYEVKNTQRGEAIQQLHLAVLGDKEWYIIMYLLTPRKDDNLYTWARNVASFEVMLETIK